MSMEHISWNNKVFATGWTREQFMEAPDKMLRIHLSKDSTKERLTCQPSRLIRRIRG